MDLNEYRVGLDRWLDEHEPRLRPERGAGVSFDDEVAHLATVKRMTFDAGWMRWGWPERVGGFGGSTLMRAYLGEALTSRDLVEPGIYSMTEDDTTTGPFERSLEIGAGTGYFSLNLMQDGVIGAATCTDISPGMLETLEGNARTLGLDVDGDLIPYMKIRDFTFTSLSDAV